MTKDKIYELLSLASIDGARTEAEILYEEMQGVSDAAIMDAIRKRSEGYPLQYIIGKWWLWDCEFEVDESCLIPRPDTETLIEQAIKRLPRGTRFADLCTGSGCVAISVLHSRSDTYADAYELFEDTLALASRNAEKNSVSDRFSPIRADVLNPSALGDNKYGAIISNPPYIRTDVVDTLDREVRHEPRAALDGGEDGLIFYISILDNFKKNLCDGGFFLFEIGYDQGDALKKLAYERQMRCEMIRDLGGRDRVAYITL